MEEQAALALCNLDLTSEKFEIVLQTMKQHSSLDCELLRQHYQRFITKQLLIRQISQRMTPQKPIFATLPRFIHQKVFGTAQLISDHLVIVDKNLISIFDSNLEQISFLIANPAKHVTLSHNSLCLSNLQQSVTLSLQSKHFTQFNAMAMKSFNQKLKLVKPHLIDAKNELLVCEEQVFVNGEPVIRVIDETMRITTADSNEHYIVVGVSYIQQHNLAVVIDRSRKEPSEIMLKQRKMIESPHPIYVIEQFAESVSTAKNSLINMVKIINDALYVCFSACTSICIFNLSSIQQRPRSKQSYIEIYPQLTELMLSDFDLKSRWYGTVPHYHCVDIQVDSVITVVFAKISRDDYEVSVLFLFSRGKCFKHIELEGLKQFELIHEQIFCLFESGKVSVADIKTENQYTYVGEYQSLIKLGDNIILQDNDESVFISNTKCVKKVLKQNILSSILQRDGADQASKTFQFPPEFQKQCGVISQNYKKDIKVMLLNHKQLSVICEPAVALALSVSPHIASDVDLKLFNRSFTQDELTKIAKICLDDADELLIELPANSKSQWQLCDSSKFVTTTVDVWGQKEQLARGVFSETGKHKFVYFAVNETIGTLDVSNRDKISGDPGYHEMVDRRKVTQSEQSEEYYQEEEVIEAEQYEEDTEVEPDKVEIKQKLDKDELKLLKDLNLQYLQAIEAITPQEFNKSACACVLQPDTEIYFSRSIYDSTSSVTQSVNSQIELNIECSVSSGRYTLLSAIPEMIQKVLVIHIVLLDKADQYQFDIIPLSRSFQTVSELVHATAGIVPVSMIEESSEIISLIAQNDVRLIHRRVIIPEFDQLSPCEAETITTMARTTLDVKSIFDEIEKYSNVQQTFDATHHRHKQVKKVRIRRSKSPSSSATSVNYYSDSVYSGSSEPSESNESKEQFDDSTIFDQLVESNIDNLTTKNPRAVDQLQLGPSKYPQGTTQNPAVFNQIIEELYSAMKQPCCLNELCLKAEEQMRYNKRNRGEILKHIKAQCETEVIRLLQRQQLKEAGKEVPIHIQKQNIDIDDENIAQFRFQQGSQDCQLVTELQQAQTADNSPISNFQSTISQKMVKITINPSNIIVALLLLDAVSKTRGKRQMDVVQGHFNLWALIQMVVNGVINSAAQVLNYLEALRLKDQYWSQVISRLKLQFKEVFSTVVKTAKRPPRVREIEYSVESGEYEFVTDEEAESYSDEDQYSESYE